MECCFGTISLATLQQLRRVLACPAAKELSSTSDAEVADGQCARRDRDRPVTLVALGLLDAVPQRLRVATIWFRDGYP
jgi:hypothetical protein